MITCIVRIEANTYELISKGRIQVLDSDSFVFITMADYSLHYMESTEKPLRMLWLPWPLYHITLCGLHCLDCREGEKQGGGGGRGGRGGVGVRPTAHTVERAAIWINGDSQHHHQPLIVSQKHPGSFTLTYCTVLKRSQSRCDRCWWTSSRLDGCALRVLVQVLFVSPF